MNLFCTMMRCTYVAWLQQEHPECITNDVASVNPDSFPVTESTNKGDISQSDISLQSASKSLSQSSTSVQESPADVQVSTSSLSVSLSQTRGLLSELSEFLNQPKSTCKGQRQNNKS